MLLLNLSDTAATSEDGSSLKFMTAIAGRQRYIQDASGRALIFRVIMQIVIKKINTVTTGVTTIN